MNREIFADAISAVHITGNMIRIDLMSLQPHLKSKDGQPVYDISQRIIMPLEGFVKSFSIQEKAIAQLIASGVLKRTEASPDAEALSETDESNDAED